MIGKAKPLFFSQNLVRCGQLWSNGVLFHETNSILVRNMSLLLNKTLINGNWVSSKTNEQFAVLNPANGSVVGHVPDLDVVDAQKALQAANDAFYSEEWTKLTAKDRSGLLKVSLHFCG